MRYLLLIVLLTACSASSTPTAPEPSPITARSTCDTEFARLVERERHPDWTSTVTDWRPWSEGSEMKTLEVIPRAYPTTTAFTSRRYEAVIDATSCTIHQYTYSLQFNPILNRLDILWVNRVLLFTQRFL